MENGIHFEMNIISKLFKSNLQLHASYCNTAIYANWVIGYWFSATVPWLVNFITLTLVIVVSFFLFYKMNLSFLFTGW